MRGEATVDVRPLLVNRHEEVTDKELRKVALSHGARVCPKVGLKDVIRLSGLPHEVFSYALRAHLDFVAVEESTHLPLFAVEADGTSHGDARAQERDAMKNELLERAHLPLLRVDETFMRSFRRFTLLGWLIEVWFLHKAWDEAQERGEVPWDEPFCHWSFFETDSQGRIIDWPYDLAFDAKRFLVGEWNKGTIPRFTPEFRMPTSMSEKAPWAEAYAILEVAADAYLVAHSRCRSFKFPGVGPWHLVEDLAEIAVADKLREFLKGEIVPLVASR
jgi:Protein of unknown function (DUF2726)